MSLINQMLQDLEKRGQAGAEIPAPRYTQFSNQAAVAAHPWRWRLVVLLVLGAALVWAYFFQTRAKPVSPVMLPTAATTPAASTMLATTPALLTQVEPELSVLGDLSLKLSRDVDMQSVVSNEAPPAAPEIKEQESVAFKEKLTNNAPARSDAATTKSVTTAAIVPAATPAVIVPIVKESSPTQRAEAEYRQASTYLQQGRQTEALAALQQVLKLDPQHAPARQALISLLLENNRQEDAMRELKQGLALDPNNSNFAMLLARLQVERANVNEAIITLQSGLPAGQERPDYLAFLAALKQKTGTHKEAIQLYRQALKKHANNAVWWMGLGISLQADGATQDAIDAYKQAKTQPGLSAELHAFVEQKIAGLQK